MSDSNDSRSRETQPARGGAPPKPPKITAKATNPGGDEPELTIRGSVPEEDLGDVLGQINRLGGQITWLTSEPQIRSGFGATIPASKITELQAWITVFTKGRGSVSESNGDADA